MNPWPKVFEKVVPQQRSKINARLERDWYFLPSCQSCSERAPTIHKFLSANLSIKHKSCHRHPWFFSHPSRSVCRLQLNPLHLRHQFGLPSPSWYVSLTLIWYMYMTKKIVPLEKTCSSSLHHLLALSTTALIQLPDQNEIMRRVGLLMYRHHSHSRCPKAKEVQRHCIHVHAHGRSWR